MKKLLLLAFTVFLVSGSFGSFSSNVVPKKASEVYIPIGDGMRISLQDLADIEIKDFEILAGRKLSFVDKLTFKAGQKQLKKTINADGTLNNRKLNKLANKMGKADGEGFLLGGFLWGFLLGLIGVLITYLIKDEKSSQRRKWAWIGFGAGVVLSLIFWLLI